MKDTEELYSKVFSLNYEYLHVSCRHKFTRLSVECLFWFIYLAQPQIIGMSATLANIDDLLKFLDAQFYEERFRPVYNKIILNFISMIYFNIGWTWRIC